MTETAKLLMEQSLTALGVAREAAQDWRKATGEIDLPAELAWAWGSAQDMRTLAGAVYAATLTLDDAMRRVKP